MDIFEHPAMASVQDDLLPFYELRLPEVSNTHFDCSPSINWTASILKEDLPDGSDVLSEEIAGLKAKINASLPSKRLHYITRLEALLNSLASQ